MAITGVAAIGQQGMGSTVRMTNKARVKLALDNSYPAGGYTSFVATTIKAVLGSKITVLDIQQAGPVNITTTFYNLVWDRANDKLMVLTAGAQASGDLSLITAAEIVVEYV